MLRRTIHATTAVADTWSIAFIRSQSFYVLQKDAFALFLFKDGVAYSTYTHKS